MVSARNGQRSSTLRVLGWHINIYMIFVGTNNSSSAPSDAEKENKSTDDDEKGEF